MSAVRKFAATGPFVRWVISSRTLTRYAPDIPVVVKLPTPPPSATATMRSGPATEPIGACCTSQRQPSMAANRPPSTILNLGDRHGVAAQLRSRELAGRLDARCRGTAQLL